MYVQCLKWKWAFCVCLAHLSNLCWRLLWYLDFLLLTDSVLCPLVSKAVDRLVGLVVRRLPRERKILGWNPACGGIFLGSSHTSDLNIGTPVATLPGAWRYRVSARTGRPGVSILWLGEMESWICNFYLSVAVRKIVWADPSLRYTRMLLGR